MGKAVTVAGLPAWATFNPTTGLVTGTPTNTGDTAITISGRNSLGQSATRTIPLTQTAPAPELPPTYDYEVWTGPGWFDLSDTSTTTVSGGNIQAVANKRPGGVGLVATGTSIEQIVDQRGKHIALFNRNADNVARLVPVTAGSDPLSRVSQGDDKPYTVIVVYTPRDDKDGYVWSWSDTTNATDAEQIAVIRRPTLPPILRRQKVSATPNNVSWGTAHVMGTPRIVAVRHTGTAVTVWDTSVTKALADVAQDAPAFSNELVFMIGAMETAAATDPSIARASCAMNFCEIIGEGEAKSDAKIQQAITDLAAKWGITLT